MSLENPFVPQTRPGDPKLGKAAARMGLSAEDLAALAVMEDKTRAKPGKKAPDWSSEGFSKSEEDKRDMEKAKRQAKLAKWEAQGFKVQTIEIGGQTAEQLEKALEDAGFQITDKARYMMQQPEFTTESKAEQIDLVHLKVEDLFGGQDTHTTDEIYEKAKDLGLELCPAEVGPHLRLEYKDQSLNEWISIAMKQITDPGGRAVVFSLEHGGDGLWLDGDWAGPARGWGSGSPLVFCLRK